MRFRWEEKRRKAVATILEKEKIIEDTDLYKTLDEFFDRGKKDVCLFCGEKERWPLVRFEFYNWRQPEKEEERFAHNKCLDGSRIKQKLDAFKLLGKNPTFNLAITCLASEQCGFFEKSTSTFNCAHVAFKFDLNEEHLEDNVKLDFGPMLYCKRAHPGKVGLPSEAELDWNVERTGLAIFLSRIEEVMKRPDLKTAWEQMKQKYPQIAEIGDKIMKDPMAFALTAMGVQMFKVTPTLEVKELEEEKKE